jgi:hypothetical protein
MTEKRKTHTWGMPVGCIPEKIIWGDTDFVETFRDNCSPSLYAPRALPARPLLSQRWKGVKSLSGIWTRRICDLLERARGSGRRPEDAADGTFTVTYTTCQ